MKKKNNDSLKVFFIKLTSITFAIIIVINLTYNLFLAEKFEAISKLIKLNDKENSEIAKDKLRKKKKKALNKEKILNSKDAELLYKFFSKIKNEVNNAAKN